MSNDKTKEILERLENGIKETLDSEKYKAFLKVQSQFHSYSFNNAMLIYIQRPDATRVAGYKSWQKLGRNVMKGEKGISILAPNPYKYEKLVDRPDPETGEKQQVKIEFKGLSFKNVSVFDIKQTDGKELPSICDELQGNSINAEKIVKAIKQISEVPIIEKNIESGAKGYYSPSEDLIAIKEGMSLDQTAKTLIHEYAHSQLHNGPAALLDRATAEVQAESVAFIVSDHFGVDTSQYSFEYLANWSSGKELAELKSSFDLIQKTADKIIQGIEEVLLKDLELEKGQQVNNNRVQELMNETYILPTKGYNWEGMITIDEEMALRAFSNNQPVYLLHNDNSESLANTSSEIKEHYNQLGSESLGMEKDQYSSFLKLLDLPIKDRVVEVYKKEFPAIKHISENTALFLDEKNHKLQQFITIKEIKTSYKHAGEWLEKENNAAHKNIFDALQNIVDDLKQAQLKELQLKSSEKAMQNQLTQSKSIEMIS